jgi:hypothetical protein
MDYMEEDLRKAFDAGESLAWHEAGEYEGYPDTIQVAYEDFEGWLKLNYEDSI